MSFVFSSQEIAKSGPLLATLAIDPSLIATSVQPLLLKPVEIKVNDPVTQAVVDNIIGKHPTKKEPVSLTVIILIYTYLQFKMLY